MKKEQILKTISSCIKQLESIRKELTETEQLKALEVPAKPKVVPDECKNAIEYLSGLLINRKLINRKLAITKTRESLVLSRIKETSLKDVRTVFYTRVIDWQHDEEMKKYLTIETMLKAKHYMKYLEKAEEIMKSTKKDTWTESGTEEQEVGAWTS